MIGVDGNWADGLLVMGIGFYLALRETIHRFGVAARARRGRT
jgi:hypothetical protein